MLGCYTVEFLALAIWIGGLVVIMGSVIPAVFNSFGVEPGGRFLTRVFEGYNRLVILAIVMLLSAAGVRMLISSRHALAAAAPAGPEMFLLGLTILSAVLIVVLLGPSSVALQEQAFTAKEGLARKTAYAAFFRTHMMVRALYLLNLILSIALVAVKLNQLIRTGFRDHEKSHFSPR